MQTEEKEEVKETLESGKAAETVPEPVQEATVIFRPPSVEPLVVTAKES